jgi:hypothetical protein
VRLCGTEEIALAAPHIKPSGLPGVQAFMSREFEEHVNFSREEKL